MASETPPVNDKIRAGFHKIASAASLPLLPVRQGASLLWNFVSGMGSVLEIMPPSTRIEAPQWSYAETLANDWAMIANDLRLAMKSAGLDPDAQGEDIMPSPSKAALPGALPSPEILEQYERILPGSAKMLIEGFAKQSEHRRAMDMKSLDARISIARWGQFLGFVIGMAALVAGAFCAYHGQQVAGSFIGTGGVVGLVSVFVLGRIKLGETTVDN